MHKTLAIASAVVRDAIRRKVVWVIVVFAALLSFITPSLESYGVGVAPAAFREVAVSLMFATSLVVALTLGSTRIPSETERRTVFNVLSRDVRRWQYIIGSWAGMFVVVGAVILAFVSISIAVGAIVYHSAMWRLLEAALAVWFEMGVVAAVAILFSSRFGVVTSVVGALVFEFVGHSVDSLWARGAEDVFAPWYVPNLAVFDVTNPVAHGSGLTLLYGVGMTGAFIGWAGVMLLVASALFRGRDL